jgi:long-chain fatty acid transport protein
MSVLLCMGMLVVALCVPGYASTFRSNGLGARARGMGGAFVAIADDASAGFWNPAGLAHITGQLTQAELKLEQIDTHYTPPDGSRVDNRTNTLVVPALGTVTPLHNRRFPALSLLGYAPYGLALDWPEDAAYRYNVTSDRIRVISVGGATAYRASDRLAVGVAAFTNDGKLNLQNKVPSTVYAGVPGLPDATFRAEGSDTNPNVHLGVLWRARPTLQVGAAYRSPIHLAIHGDADLTFPGGPVVTDTWTMPLALPQSVSVGAAWQATPALLVAGQADWVDWSSIDQQKITFTQGNLPNQQIARNWRDRTQLRLGMEYTGHSPLVVRAGYSYDPTPVPASTLDPQLFDLSRHIVSAGIGTFSHHWALDASYERFFGQDRTATTSVHAFPTPGRYTDHVDILTLTVSYRQ